MMVAPTFEIKVALIGYVSVGKTTVLNAILRDKFSEVSMRRTTAGVSNFRIHRKSSSQEDKSWPMETDEPSKTADSTLKEICEDNKLLRQQETVHEKTFNIELNEDLCEMRPDTFLTLVDIPGINEADSSSKYKDFVTDKWHTFDCAVVVMDARQGVNTEEQLSLLQLVAENRKKIKDLPTIILCNKVDEPEDQEQQELVKEAREAVERIFRVKDREAALDEVLTDNDEPMRKKPRTLTRTMASFPAFIPVSAIRAFIYQSASQLSFDEFKKFDSELIEKLGREYYGKAWRRKSKEQKIKLAFEVVNDQEQCMDGLSESNFDKFLRVLTVAVGGMEIQRNLIESQIETSIKRLSANTMFLDELKVIQKSSRALGRPTTNVAPRFWALYDECQKEANKAFQATPRKVDGLALPMKQLLEFYSWGKDENLVTIDEVNDAIIKLVRRQVATIIKYRCAGFYTAHTYGLEQILC